jgi:hypothetical protein
MPVSADRPFSAAASPSLSGCSGEGPGDCRAHLKYSLLVQGEMLAWGSAAVNSRRIRALQ